MVGRAQSPRTQKAMYGLLRAEVTSSLGPDTRKALVKLWAGEWLAEYMRDEFEKVSKCGEKNAILKNSILALHLLNKIT